MIPHWFPANKIAELKAFSDFHKLAEGAFGEVYEAVQGSPPNTREVVVKRLMPVYAQTNTKYRTLFLHEASILKTIQHPGIPGYVDGYASSRECFFIMERKHGLNLDRLLHRANLERKIISRTVSFHIIDELLRILTYLHSPDDKVPTVPIVHCDIKPQNVIVSARFEVYLIDFAMAAKLDGDLQRFPGGTKTYLPPEFFLDQSPSPASDLYSLTVLFHDLLAMKGVLKTGSDYDLFMQLLTRDYLKNISKEGFPAALEKLLLKGLAYLPEDRFADAEEYRSALSDCANELVIPFRNPGALEEEWKSSQGRAR